MEMDNDVSLFNTEYVQQSFEFNDRAATAVKDPVSDQLGFNRKLLFMFSHQPPKYYHATAIRNSNNSAYSVNWSQEFELIQIITQSTARLRPTPVAIHKRGRWSYCTVITPITEITANCTHEDNRY